MTLEPRDLQPLSPLDKVRDDTHFPVLQLLRVLSGLGIFAAHWGEPYHVTMLVQFQLTIDFFFFVEGFFAAQYLGLDSGNPDMAQTPLARLGRIYPLYLLGLILGAATYIISGAIDLFVGLLPLFGNGLVFRPSFSALAGGAVFPLNPPSWAIILEFWAFAALWPVRRHLSLVALIAIWIVSAIAMLALAFHWHDINMGWEGKHYWGGPLRMMVGFSGGMVLARLLQLWPRFRLGLHPLLVIAAAVLVHYLRIRFIALPLLFVGVPLIVLAGATASSPEWFVRIGRWAKRDAYGVYLTHYPVMTLCRDLGLVLGLSAAVTGSPLGFLAVLIIVLAAARLATRFIDEPIRKRLAR